MRLEERNDFEAMQTSALREAYKVQLQGLFATLNDNLIVAEARLKYSYGEPPMTEEEAVERFRKGVGILQRAWELANSGFFKHVGGSGGE